jgi:hypothetical protein
MFRSMAVKHSQNEGIHHHSKKGQDQQREKGLRGESNCFSTYFYGGLSFYNLDCTCTRTLYCTISTNWGHVLVNCTCQSRRTQNMEAHRLEICHCSMSRSSGIHPLLPGPGEDFWSVLKKRVVHQ